MWREWAYCMMCGEVAADATDADFDGAKLVRLWNYCRKCDCWTEHPPEQEPHEAAGRPVGGAGDGGG